MNIPATPAEFEHINFAWMDIYQCVVHLALVRGDLRLREISRVEEPILWQVAAKAVENNPGKKILLLDALLQNEEFPNMDPVAHAMSYRRSMVVQTGDDHDVNNFELRFDNSNAATGQGPVSRFVAALRKSVHLSKNEKTGEGGTVGSGLLRRRTVTKAAPAAINRVRDLAAEDPSPSGIASAKDGKITIAESPRRRTMSLKSLLPKKRIPNKTHHSESDVIKLEPEAIQLNVGGEEMVRSEKEKEDLELIGIAL